MPQMTRSAHKHGLDLTAIRSRLAGAHGKDYWRSLEQLAGTPEFQDYLQREFPEGASEWNNALGRRKFLKLMGASLAFGGLAACTRQPAEKLVPYVRSPEEVIPGVPQYFASGLTLDGIASGVLVESHTGRPTKIEGNPDHPASLGATDSFAQASVLSLYDPDRSQVVRKTGRISTWSGFLDSITKELERSRLSKGKGLRLLTETVTSPTLAHQIKTVLEQFPGAKWHSFDPVGRDTVRAGGRLAFGETVETRYQIDRARVILSLDADFLSCGPAGLRYAREFSAGRRIRTGRTEMNRLYVVESTPTNTGGMADHRLSLKAGRIEGFARAVASKLGIDAGGEETGSHDAWIVALVRDLQRNRGQSVVLAGEWQSPEVHALAHAMNHRLGNVGSTVIYTQPVDTGPADQMESLQELVSDIDSGGVELLLILGGNPVYNAPADLRFAEHLSKVKTRVHLSLYEDETSRRCHWHIPEAHPLEMWGDARAFDGTVTILQPLIQPLYSGKSSIDILSVIQGKPGRSGYDILREYWKSRELSDDFEKFWRRSLHDGVVPKTALSSRSVKLKGDLRSWNRPEQGEGLEIIFRPDPTVWDGRFANNGWLQELPKPVTRLTWDNAAMISPQTAEKLRLANEDLVELQYMGRSVEAPIWILPGHPPDSVTVHLGHGRTHAGHVGNGVGFDAYRLRTSGASWFGYGLRIRKTGKTHRLATSQDHHSMEGRNLVRVGTIGEYLENPDLIREMAHEDPSPDLTLYNPEEFRSEGYAWGMAIDLNACTGCGACTVACQSENNIPVVGKQEVLNGREMHWIRIDRYYKGDLDDPELYNQPVPCMHCENAPCELVCPVNATVHGQEGLNEMIYNRCVGTRYCANNCPYKVRRFNFLQYADEDTPSLKLRRNPDVTVRARGVMEKCTYCVQRINTSRIEAKKQDRKIRDGEVVTACQGVCPTEAIVFGDINDPESQVSRRKAEKLNYGMLTDLNTRPRTTYLAKLRNPNPEIESG